MNRGTSPGAQWTLGQVGKQLLSPGWWSSATDFGSVFSEAPSSERWIMILFLRGFSLLSIDLPLGVWGGKFGVFEALLFKSSHFNMGNKYGYEYIWIYIRKKKILRSQSRRMQADSHPAPCPFDDSVTNLLLSYGHHSYIRNSKEKW